MVEWGRECLRHLGVNNGTLINGSYTNGVVGQAFSLSGANSYVSIPDSASMDSFSNSITIELWMKAGQLTPNADWKGLVTKGNSSWRLQATTYTNTLYLGLNGVSPVDLYGTRNVNDGKWHHVAAVYDGTHSYLYVDGTLDASQPATGLIAQNNDLVCIGATSKAYELSCSCIELGYFFNGLVDEVSIYNRALSSNEIAAIYNAGSGGKCPVPPTPPIIITQPANQTNLAGTTASFSVTAKGTQPFGYQWSFNSTNLAGATNATLTLTNVQLSNAGNYTVAVTNLSGSTNSLTAALTVVSPPIITLQPQNRSVLSYQSVAFTVMATGTPPLSYQWRKNGTNLIDGGNISGSTTTNLNLATVTLADGGNYDVVVKNPYASNNSLVAVLTIPKTLLSIGSTNAMSGSTLTVPIVMNALGVENAFIASVGYDISKLVLQGVQLGQATSGAYLQEVDSQTNNGNVGFAILLNSGVTIPTGTQEVAWLVFSTLPVTNNVSTSLTFGDSPNSRQLADNNGNSLPAIYQGGSISLMPAEYAADVSPRTNGDHQVVLQDWLEVGRMVAGIDTVSNSDEMLRADCAPRNAPDGVLTVADWVQAGRYALGLDPLTLAMPSVNPNLKITSHDQPVPTRTLQIGNVSAQRGQSASVPVQLICNTNENAVGMTVIYNTNQLQFINASLGSAAVSGRLNINTNMAAGKVGLAVALSPGAALAAGTNQVVVLEFMTSTNAFGSSPLILDSSVIQLQVADKTANVLAANYVNGSVLLPLQPTLQAFMTVNSLQLIWPVTSGSFLVQSATNLSGPWSNLALNILTNGSSIMTTVQATNQQQFYRLVGQ